MTNPLAAYIRTPKIYVKLPSQAKFYDPSSIELSVNGEVAVYALTAIDQIMLKTPDAMLNGEALLKVVQNCVPGVKDVKRLVEPDINTLMLAIKIASSGQSTELDIACPNCNKEHSFNINLSQILDTQSYMDDDTSLNFNDQLILNLRPYNFEQRHLQMLNEIDEAQTLRMLDAKDDLNEADKIAEVAQQVNRMAGRTFDVLAKSVESISIIGGETVTDTAYIAEFVKGISRDQAEIIISRIRELNQIGIKTNIELVCDSCEHTWTQPLDFDPTSFFG